MHAMALGQQLPISESLGVFVGVAGIDWLADGHAEALPALALSLAAGTTIFLVRRMLRRRSKD